MKRDCSTCAYKEGSCYPSTTILDKDKTCKSYEPDYEEYIADLEAKLKHAEENCINKTCVVFKDKEDCVAKLLELEKENEQLTISYETLKLHDEEEIGMLKSENAELREKLKPENCLKLLAKDGYVKFTSDKLTKAKKIIQRLVTKLYKYTRFTDDVLAEAEQFLKE